MHPLHWLAIETSTEVVSVGAGLGGDSEAALIQAPGGAQASHTLMPAIQTVMHQVGWMFADLDAVVFGQGPGAFTGLRTACAVAQGIGLGASKPLLPLDSLSLIAQQARTQVGQHITRVLACRDARMGQVYWSALEWDDAHWQHRTAIRASPVDEVTWPEAWSGDERALIAGSWITDAHNQPLPLPRPLQQHPWVNASPGARALLQLAPAAWRRGLAVDAAQALPWYVRDKVAQTSAERQAMAAVRGKA